MNNGTVHVLHIIDVEPTWGWHMAGTLNVTGSITNLPTGTYTPHVVVKDTLGNVILDVAGAAVSVTANPPPVVTGTVTDSAA